MHLLRETFLFAVAGVLGFVVDTGVLYLMKGTLGLLFGRMISFLAAVIATWLFNRSLTFRHRQSGLGLGREFVSYLMLMMVGGAVNYVVYAWLVVSYRMAEQYPVLAVAAGSVVGMFVNFVNSKMVLFRRKL